MKQIVLSALVVCFASSAYADCVISPDARGSTSEGTLCTFGEDADVYPEGAPDNQPRYSDYLFSPDEELKMLKGIVTRNRSSGNGVLESAIQGATTSRHKISNTPVTVRTAR